MGTFDRNVFVNCPFDQDYLPLFRPLLFTILYLGLKPRVASESSDSGELRLRKIVGLIRQSRFGIHDLSRCRAASKGEFFRLNMPFELGIDYGCREFHRARWRQKRFLVLEAKCYSYQKSLSDLAGADTASHGNDPRKVIEVVRHWLVQEAGANPRPVSEIHAKFEDFMTRNYSRLIADGYKPDDIRKLPIMELKDSMEKWVAAG
jgi:hypothetical protein